VHHLLSHLSGIPRDFKKGHSFTGRKLYKAMKKSRPDFPAGTQFSYSNIEFILLGQMVEQVSGEPLEAFLQQRVFGPLRPRLRFPAKRTHAQARRPKTHSTGNPSGDSRDLPRIALDLSAQIPGMASGRPAISAASNVTK
jgi:CubicO group peptidase (beta-lactamase class C family)